MAVSCRISICLLVFLAITGASVIHGLKIAAFNVQIFGTTKASKPDVRATLVRIISRYDIVLIQEIRDASGTAIYALLNQTNADNAGNPFDIEISGRLGRTSSKEQYAFFYRPKSGLDVVNTYTYNDVTADVFQREPYIVLFESTSTVLKKFAIAGIHVDPGDAVNEIKALGDVFDDIKSRMNVKDVMVMGDFNADCSYVPKSKWDDIPLRNNSAYTWFIGDDEDTTVSGTDCAYDRFVVTGEGFSTSADGRLVPGSAKVFKFDAEYGLTPEEADAVSDHYPIELELTRYTSGSTRVTNMPLAWAIAIFVYLTSIF